MLPADINDMPEFAHELLVRWVVLSSPALQLAGDNIKHMHLIICVQNDRVVACCNKGRHIHTNKFMSHLLLHKKTSYRWWLLKAPTPSLNINMNHTIETRVHFDQYGGWVPAGMPSVLAC